MVTSRLGVGMGAERGWKSGDLGGANTDVCVYVYIYKMELL